MTPKENIKKKEKIRKRRRHKQKTLSIKQLIKWKRDIQSSAFAMIFLASIGIAFTWFFIIILVEAGLYQGLLFKLIDIVFIGIGTFALIEFISSIITFATSGIYTTNKVTTYIYSRIVKIKRLY